MIAWSEKKNASRMDFTGWQNLYHATLIRL
jgi:hypothetical protein